VNFDEREVAEIKPSSGFGKATVSDDSIKDDSATDELNRVD
jgi:hypothetical protein